MTKQFGMTFSSYYICCCGIGAKEISTSKVTHILCATKWPLSSTGNREPGRTRKTHHQTLPSPPEHKGRPAPPPPIASPPLLAHYHLICEEPSQRRAGDHARITVRPTSQPVLHSGSRLRALLASPAAYLALLHLVILWWLWRDLPLERLHPPAVQEEQPPPRDRTLLYPDRVGVAAVRGVLEGCILRPILLGRRTPHANAHGYFRHQSVNFLEAVRGDLRLVDPESMDEMIRGSPRAVQMLRQASIHCDPIGRLSDNVENPSIFQADPCMLATESTEMIINLKVVTVLVCLVWRELNGQYQQVSQELKEECFTLVAGKSVEKLLEVARSFSEASWCACHVKEVLTILDTLVDVLYNVHGLPLNKSDEVASISCKIVDALKGILDGTSDDIYNREESAVHPVNVVLIQVLEFFLDKRHIVQSLIPAGNPCSDMFNSWESKVEKDTERALQYEKGKRYIILLNNAYDVWQMMRLPGASSSDVELVSMLICMIQRYMKSYIDDCWVPLIMPLSKEDYLKRPRRAFLDEFTQGFVGICHCQMTWKVLPALRSDLRAEIKIVVVTPYKGFLRALQANPSQLSEVVYSFKLFMRGKKNQNAYTAEQLEYLIKQFFES